MTIRNLMISTLGLGIFVHPASASMSFFNSSGAYNTAVTNASLTPEGPFTFTGANVINSNTEYADPTSLIDFFAFQNNNSSNPGNAFTFSINGTSLAAANGTSALEIVLPANVFAFGITLSSNSLAQFCGNVGSTDSSCTNSVLVTSSTDNEFFGVVSTTAISTVWIGRNVGGPPISVNFSAATGSASATPEVKSMFLLGLGLVLLGLLKRRARASARSARYSPAALRP